MARAWRNAVERRMSESRVRENLMHGLMRGGWKFHPPTLPICFSYKNFTLAKSPLIFLYSSSKNAYFIIAQFDQNTLRHPISLYYSLISNNYSFFSMPIIKITQQYILSDLLITSPKSSYTDWPMLAAFLIIQLLTNSKPRSTIYTFVSS